MTTQLLIYRHPRHREHGGRLRRQPPPLHRRRRGRPRLAARGRLLRRRRVLPRARLVLQRALHPPLRPPAPATRTTPRCCSPTGPRTRPPRTTSIVNVVLLPLWTIIEGRRRGLQVGLDLLRDEPLHQPGLLRRVLPRLHGAPAALQPVARLASEHGVAAVVAGDERDPGPAVAPGPAQVQPLDRHRVVRPAPSGRAGTAP